jgi:hypothetical protein
VALLRFLQFQHPNGEISDGYVINQNVTPNTVELFKNTCETDQETSLVQAIAKYVRRYNDTAVLQQQIGNMTVWQRLVFAFEFLLNERFDKEHGLIWGGTTVGARHHQ